MLCKGRPDSILHLFGRGRRARVFARAPSDPRGACSKPDDSSANCVAWPRKTRLPAGRDRCRPNQIDVQQCECAIARRAYQKSHRSSNRFSADRVKSGAANATANEPRKDVQQITTEKRR
jgi:hypothetical protein